MFYRPGIDDHGLPHNPLKAMIVPRPIGWISTVDAEGRANLAPYSFFNGLSDAPPMVMFSTTGPKPGGAGKDSVANVRATGEFCANLVGWELKDAMNVSAAHLEAGEDEFEAAGLEKAPCEVISVPRVKAAAGALECRLWQVIDLPGDNYLTIGEVVGIHIDEAMLNEGIFDATRWQPVSRLGYRDYAVVRELFSMNRPGQR
ncbi:flavin reductase family protein [Paroceanicella profunda]|uniref:Flavin reductase family protein n=1 Tax=Paroceanicella profunda TaxID=2579971 RepID=A0A5B8FWP4_9RHOB|nr:flavin reductase family protein [Paroceanicella profunda]QDL91964.1 flavin reductase family protein [Paroceanicella profunda]